MNGSKRFAGRAALLLCVAALIGCGGDDGTTPTAGTGGGAAVSGTGMPAAGSGTTAGTGAAGGGTAGGAAGTTAAGGGGLTCADAKQGAPAALHMAAATALLPTTGQGPCAFGSCHDSSAKKAGLVLVGGAQLDLKSQTVGKPACQVPSLMLVDGSGGDAALAKSWLWQKLVAASDSSGELTPNPAWGTPVLTCAQDSGSMFGLRMPRTQTDMKLGMEKLSAIRDWICAGAPGPG